MVQTSACTSSRCPLRPPAVILSLPACSTKLEPRHTESRLHAIVQELISQLHCQCLCAMAAGQGEKPGSNGMWQVGSARPRQIC